MKPSILIPLAALARHATASNPPQLQFDPNTTKDCIEWYDNINDTCEYVRSYFTITPEEFHKWNPSVGLDCKPWYEQVSYCIVTRERMENWERTRSKSSSISPSTTVTTSTPRPSPTAWEALGCYAENPQPPQVLNVTMSPTGGDVSLTVPICKDRCYRGNYEFAGVTEGNQCRCGDYVPGEWTNNQADCNVPCIGDKNTVCGGKGVLNIFGAQKNNAVSTSVVTTTGGSVSTIAGARSGTSTAVNTAVASSGAMRNVALFGLEF